MREKLMKHSTFRTSLVLVGLAFGLSSGLKAGDDDQKKLSVTVSFGAGLNTAQPGNAANHHVLPRTIRLKAGGVVNFAVAGFHQIFVYQPGVGPADIDLSTTSPPFPFINDLRNLYYKGINPAGGPLATLPTANPSNASNRVEPVSFSEPGTYLVICNVRGHFLDGMYAFVVVTGNDD